MGGPDATGMGKYTKYMAESAKLEGGDLRLGWEIPGHPTLCMKHCPMLDIMLVLCTPGIILDP